MGDPEELPQNTQTFTLNDVAMALGESDSAYMLLGEDLVDGLANLAFSEPVSLDGSSRKSKFHGVKINLPEGYEEVEESHMEVRRTSMPSSDFLSQIDASIRETFGENILLYYSGFPEVEGIVIIYYSPRQRKAGEVGTRSALMVSVEFKAGREDEAGDQVSRWYTQPRNLGI